MAQIIRDFWSQVNAYVTGRLDLPALHDWLAAHVQEIADSGDTELEVADGLLWTLTSEKGYGHRSEAEVKSIVTSYLRDNSASSTMFEDVRATPRSRE